MKVRTGFVSNSSSSSFVLALDKKPESVEEVLKMFSLPDVIKLDYDWDDYSVTAQEAAQSIFSELKDKDPLSVNDIAEEFSHGHPLGDFENIFPDYPHWEQGESSEENNRRWDEWQIERDRIAVDVAGDFVKKNKGRKFYSIEYSDNEGTFRTTMEHGNAFDNVEHVKVSHH